MDEGQAEGVVNQGRGPEHSLIRQQVSQQHHGHASTMTIPPLRLVGTAGTSPLRPLNSTLRRDESDLPPSPSTPRASALRTPRLVIDPIRMVRIPTATLCESNRQTSIVGVKRPVEVVGVDLVKRARGLKVEVGMRRIGLVARATMVEAMEALSEDGTLDFCKARALVRAWDSQSFARRSDVTCGATAAMLRVLTPLMHQHPHPPPQPITSFSIDEVICAGGGGSDQMRPWLRLEGDEEGVLCGYVCFRGRVRIWACDDFQARFFTPEQAIAAVDQANVLPECVFASLFAAEQQREFFRLLVEHSMASSTSEEEMEMLTEVAAGVSSLYCRPCTTIMSFVFDSLRAHNGCLSLFDVKDLVCEFRRRGAARGGGMASRPRQYRLQRVPVAPSSTEAQGTATKPTRVLLPSLHMWNGDSAAIARADTESIARAEATLGIVFLVQENSKIRVIRDDRTRDDLKSAFPDVEESILDEVWSRTRLFTAAYPILVSLRNSGHHVAGGGPVDLRLEDEDAWPALFEETTSEGSSMGWEHMPAPEGEEWVLIDEEDEADHSEDDRPAPTGAGGDDTEMRARTYREVLLLNLMNSGREWPVAPSPRPPLHATVPVVRGKFKEKLQSLVAFEHDADYGYMGNFEAEYYLEKAVAARTHSHVSRKRLTCTGKARLAAKMARRAMVDDEENDEDVEATL